MAVKVIHTADSKMKEVLRIAENVAPSRATILIQGESGTGKELLAQYIHTKSHRASKTFVALNCAAVPDGLLESELFGFEKGSFTGADNRKIGKFELAHMSTLMLDEISELPLNLQSKILRVLQEGEIERVGGVKPIKIDVRIIAASNKKLSDLVSQGKFREDLFYRLNVIPVEIPPLRLRRSDINLLSELFVGYSCSENGIAIKKFTALALAKLTSWKWPGNVRELQNVIERAVLLTAGSEISDIDLVISNFEEGSSSNEISAGMTVQEAEKLLILKTLEFTSQNRTQAAHMLGISIRTLRNKLSEYRSEFISEDLNG